MSFKNIYYWRSSHIWQTGRECVSSVFFVKLADAGVPGSFVFDPYTWHWDPNEPYSDFEGKIVPSRIPWHAFLQGVLILFHLYSGFLIDTYARPCYR